MATDAKLSGFLGELWAQLGMFKHALEKIAEAYKLFQWYDQADQAVADRDLVEQVNLHCSQNQETHGTV